MRPNNLRVIRNGRYQLGDAQIDAQNDATRQIGVVLNQYNSIKAMGQLTVAYAQNAMAQIQQIVNNYAQAYGGTSRGEAGRVTLQTFITSKVFPGIQTDMQSIGPVTPITSTPTQPDMNASPSPVAYNPNVDYTINVSPGSTAMPSSVPGDVQPSMTPQSPLAIPGVTQTVTAEPEPWYQNKTLWVVGGIALLWFMHERN